MYLVLNEDGKPLQLDFRDDLPRAGVLFQGDYATLFPNYKSAWRAWKRSEKYADDNGFLWRAGLWKTMRAVPK